MALVSAICFGRAQRVLNQHASITAPDGATANMRWPSAAQSPPHVRVPAAGKASAFPMGAVSVWLDGLETLATDLNAHSSVASTRHVPAASVFATLGG